MRSTFFIRSILPSRYGQYCGINKFLNQISNIMKTIALNFALILLTILFFTSCEKENFNVTPSDSVTSEDYTISDFSKLDISEPFNVYVTFSETEQALRIEANDNLHTRIQVEQHNGELSIALEDNTNISHGTVVLNAFVTTRDISTINAAGAAHVFLQNEWNGDRLKLKLTGACSLAGSINANHLDAELTGASNLNIEGSADRFEIEATGASNMEDFSFETNELSADLTGGCNVSLTVNEKLNVKANGASMVYYKGNGLVEDQDLSGGSQIIKVE